MTPDKAQSLALQRTFLAHERTLMAWVRTGASLMSFGFAIYKFFVYLSEEEGRRHRVGRLGFGPWEFAVGMISVGILSLVLAVLQERRALKLLEVENNTKYSSLAEKIAAILAFVGLWLLTIVLFRL